MQAYAEALALRKDRGEPLIFQAQLHERAGNDRGVVAAHLRAMTFPDTRQEAQLRLVARLGGLIDLAPDELARIAHNIVDRPTNSEDAMAMATHRSGVVDRLAAADRAAMPQALTEAELALAELAWRGAAAAGDIPPRILVFDISDLIVHIRRHRLPTGIQRVQIEVVTRVLRTIRTDRVRVCCYVQGRNQMVGVDLALFMRMASFCAGLTSGTDLWAETCAELLIRLELDDSFMFPDDAILVNLGTSWWIHDYFLLIRNAKERHRILYVPFVHDLIPAVVPEFVVPGIVMDYVIWLVGAFDHADHYLVNSRSTRDDLIGAAARLGHRMDEERIEVVPLDADFRRESHLLDPARLAAWGLEDRAYVLFVSTIEIRKNHVLAFSAWRELIERHGQAAVPPLVCVGREGWLNDKAFAFLRDFPEVARMIVFVDRVSDDELALLYRSALFSVYPSHYEGWGLPVTESLCYGRIPIVADGSSLPQAASDLGVAFPSGSATALADAVALLAFDEDERSRREAEIRARFAPRSWSEVANQICSAAIRSGAASMRAPPQPPAVQPGLFYPVKLHDRPGIWLGAGSGEALRVGTGWLWPQPDGCRLRDRPAELAFRVAARCEMLRLYLRVRGLASRSCRITVSSSEKVLFIGRAAPQAERWIAGDLPLPEDGLVRLTLEGSASEPITLSTGGVTHAERGSFTLLGLAVCDASDEAGRAAFVSHALGDLDGIDAFAPRRVHPIAERCRA